MSHQLWIGTLIYFSLSQMTLAFSPPETLLKKLDHLYRSNGSQGKIEMEVMTPDWSRTIKMDMWTKGMDFTFITIREPKKDKGVSSLKRKNEMWNFFPKINKVIKVPPSMMMGSWMGSDFTNDDLIKNSSLLDDYNLTTMPSDKTKIVISLKPKKEAVSLWGRIEIVLNKKTELPEKQEYYDEKGDKIRILHFKNVKTFGSKTIPSILELEPLTKKGYKTIIRYSELKFDLDVPESTFTLTNLQKRR